MDEDLIAAVVGIVGGLAVTALIYLLFGHPAAFLVGIFVAAVLYTNLRPGSLGEQPAPL